MANSTMGARSTADALRARERALLWNTTFRTLYGAPSGETLAGIEPGQLPGPEVIGQLSRSQLVARPELLRRVLGPPIATGDAAPYRPHLDYRELVIASVRDIAPWPRSFDDAFEELRRIFSKSSDFLPGDDVEKELFALERLLAPEELILTEGPVIRQHHGVSTVSRRARFRVPLDAFKPMIDPKNWLQMGPFFEAVGPIESEKTERDDGWEGVLEERFVVDWSGLELQRFHTFLKVDYTFDDDRVRADYSLIYEIDDQIERDSGFIEARRVPGRPQWCEYYAEKVMRFRAAQANLYSPIIMSAFLQSGLNAMEEKAVGYNLRARIWG